MKGNLKTRVKSISLLLLISLLVFSACSRPTPPPLPTVASLPTITASTLAAPTPSPAPIIQQTAAPAPTPTAAPAPAPTPSPTAAPTPPPTPMPTVEPTPAPTPLRTPAPTPAAEAQPATRVGTVRYTEGGQMIEVVAFMGQALVFFPPAISESEARAKLTAQNVTVLDGDPEAGFYLAGMKPGSEGAFMDAILRAGAAAVYPRLEERLNGISPAPASQIVSPLTIHVLDACEQGHGKAVAKEIEIRGFKTRCYDVSATCADGSNGCVDEVKATKWLLKIARDNKGSPVLINYSGGVGCTETCYWPDMSPERQKVYLAQQRASLRLYLQVIAWLPEDQRRNVILAHSAGNDGAPLKDIMAEARKDPKLGPALSDHFLNVSTDSMKVNGKDYSNKAEGDPDVVKKNNDAAKGGTSLAAPAALADIAKVIVEGKISVIQAIHAAKDAAKANPKGELIAEEAMVKAGAVVKPPAPPVPPPAPTTPTPTITATITPWTLAAKWSGGFTETSGSGGKSFCETSGDLRLELTKTGNSIGGTLIWASRTSKKINPNDSAYDCAPEPFDHRQPLQGTVSSTSITFESGDAVFTGSYTSDLMRGTYSSKPGSQDQVKGCFKVTTSGGLPGC